MARKKWDDMTMGEWNEMLDKWIFRIKLVVGAIWVIIVFALYFWFGSNIYIIDQKGENLMDTEKGLQLSAKLHPEFDKELIKNIIKIPKRERSYTYREALNKYFKDKQEDGKCQ